MIPPIMTLLGLCAGLTSIRLALEARFGAAAVAVVVAGCIDGLDGRLARLLRATSRFGAEIDSLADFLCFGVAPAFVLYIWSGQGGGGFGFVPCLIFAVCMSLRLARFNAAIDAEPKRAFAQSFFTGVPAPAGAGLALFPLFVGLEAHRQGWATVEAVVRSMAVIGPLLIGVAFLLVSTLPVWSFKNFKVRHDLVLPMLLAIMTFAAVLVTDPWIALAAAGLIYLGMLPLSARSFRRLRAAAEGGGAL